MVILKPLRSENMESPRFPLSPRSPKISTNIEEDNNIKDTNGNGVPTYFSKSQFASAKNTIFDQKLQELLDGNERLTKRKKQRKMWLTIIRNYTKYNTIKGLARHLYSKQMPQRYNTHLTKMIFQRWKIRYQWRMLSSIMKRVSFIEATGDDKERISERRVLLSAKYLTNQQEYQPNLDFFIFNAIPNPTSCTAEIIQEDLNADKQEDLQLQAEFERHLEEEEERNRRKKKKKRSTKKNTAETTQISQPETPQIDNREIVVEEEDKNSQIEHPEPQIHTSISTVTTETMKDANKAKSPRPILIFVAILAFVLGFMITLQYYVHSGEINDTQSFFSSLKTHLFGRNVTEKCMLDPECRANTERMKYEAEQAKLKTEQDEKIIRKLQKIAESKDPETRDAWIRQELKKISNQLKTIYDEQDDMNDKIQKIKETTQK